MQKQCGSLKVIQHTRLITNTNSKKNNVKRNTKHGHPRKGYPKLIEDKNVAKNAREPVNLKLDTSMNTWRKLSKTGADKYP